MEATTTNAEELAEEMESEDGNVEVTSVRYDRITFNHEGAVHTNHIPDDWRVIGIGTGWFSIGQRL